MFVFELALVGWAKEVKICDKVGVSEDFKLYA